MCLNLFVLTRRPRRQQSQNTMYSKISYIKNPAPPPPPGGHVMSVKCGQPLDELDSPILVTVSFLNF